MMPTDEVSPGFQIGEVIVVRRMIDWPARSPDVVGKRGTVISFTPNEEHSGWDFAVMLDDLEDVWVFSPEELATTGLVQMSTGERAPMEHRAVILPAPITLRLRFAQSSDATGSVSAAESAIRRAIDVDRVETVSKRGAATSDYDAEIDVWPVGSERAAFETLTGGGSGRSWIREFDDGWSCDFWWSAEGGEVFLTPQLLEAGVALTPWNNPTRHNVPPGRAQSPELPT